MPRVVRVKVKMKDPDKLTDAFFDAIAEALSEYSQRIYPLVIAYAPKEKGSKDPRRIPGMIAKNIQLMEADFMGRRYLTLGIPGSKVPDSEQYRAMMATQALHYGWAAPKTIQGKPVLTFPVGKFQRGARGKKPPGMEGAKRWVVTPTITRSGRYRKDPWIHKIILSTLPLYEEILNKKIQEKLNRVPEKKVV